MEKKRTNMASTFKKHLGLFFLFLMHVANIMMATLNSSTSNMTLVDSREPTTSIELVSEPVTATIIKEEASRENDASTSRSMKNILHGKKDDSVLMESTSIPMPTTLTAFTDEGTANITDNIAANAELKYDDDSFHDNIYSFLASIVRITGGDNPYKKKVYEFSSFGIEGILAGKNSFVANESRSTSVSSEENHDLPPVTYDLTDCLLARSVLNLQALDAVLHLNNVGTDSNETRCCHFRCYARLSVPRDTIMYVAFDNKYGQSCKLFSIKLTVTSNITGQNIISSCDRFHTAPVIKLLYLKQTYTVLESDTEIEVDVTDLTKNIFFSINITFQDVSDAPKLEGVFTSKYSGYIQTPGYDGHTFQALNINSWVRLDIPQDHTVLVSFLPLNMPSMTEFCMGGRIAIFVGNLSSTTVQQVVCSKFRPRPQLFDTNALFVHFTSEKVQAKIAGFKVLFSIHNNTAMPEKLESGSWNCSVPHWTDFQQHFPCNLQADCVDGRDEADCPYTNTDCGIGQVSVGGNCYIYFLPAELTDTLSWKDANRKCQLRGAELASLNSPQKWKEVEAIMHFHEYNVVYIGLKSTSDSLPSIYEYMFQHMDGTIAYFMGQIFTTIKVVKLPACLHLYHVDYQGSPTGKSCTDPSFASVLCEFQPDRYPEPWLSEDQSIPLNGTGSASFWTTRHNYLQCPAGHMTHDFMACDFQTGCWSQGNKGTSCSAPLTPLPPLFTCTSNQRIPYTLVCDHIKNCRDNSDEDFCVFPLCDFLTQFQCDSSQCVPLHSQCDNIYNCFDKSDERQCRSRERTIQVDEVYPPAQVDFDGKGSFTLRSLENSPRCPDTHFRCPGDGYCLPVFVRCNGAYDCPGHEDERGCDKSVCPGFYRCRSSHTCLHYNYVCDGVHHCPQRDDELLCEAECPEQCVCYGMAFFCSDKFLAGKYPDLRFLDGSSSSITFEDVVNNSMLVYMKLAHNNLTNIDNVTLINLQILDLSDNKLSHIRPGDLSNLLNLRHLYISGNPLSSVFAQAVSSLQPLPRLRSLHVTRVFMPQVNLDSWSIFSFLEHLNLSNNGIDRLIGDGFQILENLRVLDLRGNPMTYFSPNIFQGLDSLVALKAENYKLCCPSMLPSRFNTANCKAPSDEISSCQELLQSNIYRGFLLLFAFLSLLGNFSSFLFRAITNWSKTKNGFDIFVANLSVADFLMGIYLSIIGLADLSYRGNYLWNDVTWRNSVVCKVAGFLSLLSSEVSAFIICLITLDRFLVLRFPLSGARFSTRSSLLASTLVWATGTVIAGIPLVPWTSHWAFYSQSGICIPLPITRNTFPGHNYSFSIMVVFNFILVILIAVGQLCIYWSVQKNKVSTLTKNTSSKDLTVARRLFAIAFSDFLCWCPLGVLGFMASTGTPISGEVNVAIAVFVLPVNSAINPFLYTLNVMMKSRREKREDRLKQMLMSHVRTQTSTTNTTEALQYFKSWINSGVLSKESVFDFLSERDVVHVTTTSHKLRCHKDLTNGSKNEKSLD